MEMITYWILFTWNSLPEKVYYLELGRELYTRCYVITIFQKHIIKIFQTYLHRSNQFCVSFIFYINSISYFVLTSNTRNTYSSSNNLLVHDPFHENVPASLVGTCVFYSNFFCLQLKITLLKPLIILFENLRIIYFTPISKSYEFFRNRDK